jgi:hypothetical protein
LNELEKIDQVFSVSKQTEQMLQILKQGDLAITKATQSFNKTQSQFMDNMLTVSHPTPIRNIRQILAEMKKSKQALAEATYNTEKLKIEIKQIDKQLCEEDDDIKRELLELDRAKKYYDINQINDNMEGAIRKLTNYQLQFDSILKENNIENINELDFEKEEEEYHIKKSFQQALSAARSRNGIVDHGNLEYFQQIGLSSALAQFYIQKFLLDEKNKIAAFLEGTGPQPSINSEIEFLEEMYQVFKGSAITVAEKKGMKLISEQAINLQPES